MKDQRHVTFFVPVNDHNRSGFHQAITRMYSRKRVRQISHTNEHPAFLWAGLFLVACAAFGIGCVVVYLLPH